MDISRIQQVPRASSDELLRKFADSEEEGLARKEFRAVVAAAKRRKRSLGVGEVENCCEMPANGSASLVERKSLLPTTNRRSPASIRNMGIGRSKHRSRNFKKRSFLGVIEKTWRRTVEGASKVFIERHYNRHKRLINDFV